MGKPKDPDYFKKYRASHPDYAARDRARNRDHRKRVVRARAPRDRTAEYARRATRAARAVPIPRPYVGHELFDQALAVVGPDRSGLKVFKDPIHEDLMSVAVLALLEGEDAVEAVRRARSAEYGWRYVALPLLMK